MHMVGDASYPIAFATGIAGHGGEIGVESGAHRNIQGRSTIFGTEDDVDEQIRERLRHGQRINRAFSPCIFVSLVTQTDGLGWDHVAPLALS